MCLATTTMNIFRSKKKLTISERDPTYKVKYLGNVQTALMKGDGCVDKPTGVLWNNHLKMSKAGLEMKLVVSASGLKAYTQEQGLTEYRAHRISYCIAHPSYPRLFVWVYRHEGKKMKVELRCHAVLCKSDVKAKALAVHLHDKLSISLHEFMREKNRRQTSRLAQQRAASLPTPAGGTSVGTSNNVAMSSWANLRRQFLGTSQNFKPPVEQSPGAPKLGAISEGQEEEEEEEEEEEREEYRMSSPSSLTSSRSTPTSFPSPSGQPQLHSSSSDPQLNDLVDDFYLEMGNDIDELRKDASVRHQLHRNDSDDSSESGFSEQDNKEATGATGATCDDAEEPVVNHLTDPTSAEDNDATVSHQVSDVTSDDVVKNGDIKKQYS